MSYRLLANYPVATAAAAFTLLAALPSVGQTTTTTSTVTLTPQQQTQIREYVVKEQRPSMTVESLDVEPGATLPPNVTFYSVPQSDQYQYTVVNQKRVLVDPATRRVVEVIQESNMPQSGSSSETYERRTTTTEEHD